jgi:excinuclease UvrABC ATPase subunit
MMKDTSGSLAKRIPDRIILENIGIGEVFLGSVAFPVGGMGVILDSSPERFAESLLNELCLFSRKSLAQLIPSGICIYSDQKSKVSFEVYNGLPLVIDLNQLTNDLNLQNTLGETIGISNLLEKVFFHYGSATCNQCQNSLAKESAINFSGSNEIFLGAYFSSQYFTQANDKKAGKLKIFERKQRLAEQMFAFGYSRHLCGNQIYKLNDGLEESYLKELEKSEDFSVILDRLSVGDSSQIEILEERVRESLQTSKRLGAKFLAVFEKTATGEIRRIKTIAEGFYCEKCLITYSNQEVHKLGLLKISDKSLDNLQKMTFSEIRAFFDSDYAFKTFPSEESSSFQEALSRKLKELLYYCCDLGLGQVSYGTSIASVPFFLKQRVAIASVFSDDFSDVLFLFRNRGNLDREILFSALRKLTGNGNTVLVSTDQISESNYMDEVFVLEPTEIAKVSKEKVKSCAKLAKDCLKKKLELASTEESRTLHIIGASDFFEPCSFLPNKINAVFGRYHDSALSLEKVRKGALGIESKNLLILEFNGFAPLNSSTKTNLLSCKLGLSKEIASHFAGLSEARKLGLGAKNFDWESSYSRCEVCHGLGFNIVEMEFLSPTKNICSQCLGQQFNQLTLQVHDRGKTISDVHDLSINEAFSFFHSKQKIAILLEQYRNFFLGHLKLNQLMETLSKIDLAKVELARLLTMGTAKSIKILAIDRLFDVLDLEQSGAFIRSLKTLENKKISIIIFTNMIEVGGFSDFVFVPQNSN